MQVFDSSDRRLFVQPVRVGSFNLLDTNSHVDSRKTFLNERLPSNKDKEGISIFFFFFWFGKGTGFESNYSRNEPDRLVSKIASLLLIRAFSRFDKVDVRSKVDTIRPFRSKMEFQSGLALIIVQRGWLNCSRNVFLIKFIDAYHRSSRKFRIIKH